MAWKCSDCGYPDIPDEVVTCPGCGYVKCPASVSLTSPATGKSMSIRINTDVGKYMLKPYVGDDYRYASDPQFRIVKQASAGQWIVQHMPGAKNPTFYNGAELPESGQALEEGGVISIGPEKAKLVVSLK